MTTLPLVSLVVSVACLIYVVITTRRTAKNWHELNRLRAIGMDAYVGEQIQRWTNGEIPSKTEKGVGVSGTDVEVIEPMPGWKIVVGTVAHGKRVPLTNKQNG